MKDLRPINIQVEELTKEQKDNICKVYRWNMLVSVSAIILGVILVVFSSICYFQRESAYEEYEDATATLYSSVNLNVKSKTGELYKDYLEASEKFEFAILLTLITSVILFISVLSVTILIKKKYPYYSEQRYNYINKKRKRRNT